MILYTLFISLYLGKFLKIYYTKHIPLGNKVLATIPPHSMERHHSVGSLCTLCRLARTDVIRKRGPLTEIMTEELNGTGYKQNRQATTERTKTLRCGTPKKGKKPALLPRNKKNTCSQYSMY